jgi:hypothetical protein
MNHIFCKSIICFSLVLLIACSPKVIEKKKVRKKKISPCPTLVTDKYTDNLTTKTADATETQLIATIKVNPVACHIDTNTMTLQFDIMLDAQKTVALENSVNAFIPLNYYITLNLTPHQSHQDSKVISHTKNAKGIYFMTLKEIGNHKMTASQTHTVNLPIQDYDLQKSTINIGFISEDNSIILN